MKGKRKEKVNKEEICEDWCFVCKDGGSLFICEYKDCLKAYHAECVGKDESFFETGGRLTCQWHSCFICCKRSKYHCYCCPRAVCGRCISVAEFAKLRGNKGICINCLKILLLGEEHKEADSDGEKVDMKDRDTCECLLYEYWLIIKEKEKLSLKDLHFAKNLLKRGETQMPLSNHSGSDKYADEGLESSSSEDDSRSDFGTPQPKKRKRSKGQKASKNMGFKSKRREFVGWASKPLMGFLESIGEDTSKELSENDMVSIINRYITKNRLFNPEKKKKIMCDEKLKTLFGKKTFMRNRMPNLLELHFRENAEFYERDQFGYSSEENSEKDNTAREKPKKMVTSKKSQREEVIIESLQSCFAAIVAENIKLVYLKKCVVMELLREPETFESKIIGSFVKVKSDPYDYTQKNPYQLVQVNGVKNNSPGFKKEDILLQVSERLNDFSISMLSDANFSEEECEDLSERVKNEQLQKLTIVEIEKKARTLHQVIMKNRIAEELTSLQNQIDHANEKGRRAELFHFMERKMLLETKAEQTRLLEEVPKVIADIPEIEPFPEDANKELKHGYEIASKSIITGSLGSIGKNWGDNIASSGEKAVTGDKSLSGNSGSVSANYGDKTTKRDEVPSNNQGDKAVNRGNSFFGDVGSVSANYGNGTTKGDEVPSNPRDSDGEESVCNDQSDATQRISEPRECGSQMQSQNNDVEQKTEKNEKTLPVELSSNDGSGDSSRISPRNKKAKDLDAPIWHCLGPYGDRKGPFSLSLLKRWGDSARYALKFKVWKTGDSEENAIMLSSAVSKFYPGD